MANTRRIASTVQAGLRPLGVQGQLAAHAYSQLARLVETRLSAHHAAIFAEPVADAAANRVDWYTSADGPVRRLADLPETEQAQTLETLRGLGADIAGLAKEYTAHSDPDRQLIGKLLTLALQYPGDQDVYRVGERPVLVSWGHASDDTSFPPQDLARARVIQPGARLARAAGEETAADPALASGRGHAAALAADETALLARERFAWLGFLAWLLLGLLIMLAILAAWHRWWPERLMYAPWRWHVVRRIEDPLTMERAQESALRLELSQLREQFAAQRAGCPQVSATPPIAPPKPQPGSTGLNSGPAHDGSPIQRSGGAQGETAGPMNGSETPSPPNRSADKEFDERLQREHAKDGELQVSLVWNNVNDLDLAVIEPDGKKINYHTRSSPSGGTLDVDMNASRISSEPVENIYWPPGHAAPGHYKVYVRYFQANPGPQSGEPTPFKIRIKMGDVVEEASGILTLGAPPTLVKEFEVPSGQESARAPAKM